VQSERSNIGINQNRSNIITSRISEHNSILRGESCELRLLLMLMHYVWMIGLLFCFSLLWLHLWSARPCLWWSFTCWWWCALDVPTLPLCFLSSVSSHDVDKWFPPV